MESLELSNTQSIKLLEMCKILFPGYKEYVLSDQQGRCKDYQHGISKLEYVLFTGDMGGIALKIHWFEFTMTYLSAKILSKNDNKYIMSELDTFCGVQNGHPIDLLYEKFKKI